MTKVRIKRFYYRNGSIHTEVREVAKQFHGRNRAWHFNGKLAEELMYWRGLLHGTSRQWDEHGNLLGSFEMVRGTGTQRFWHDNGQIKMEIDSFSGKFHGRTRVWLRDGTLVRETFHIHSDTVSRTRYLKAAREHPDWPQYKGQPTGRVARNTIALQRKQHELFIASILEKDHAEARHWLGVEKLQSRSLAKFQTPNAAFWFMEMLYAAGAEAVFVAPIYRGKHGKLFADWLLVKLPTKASKRRQLRMLCLDLCCKHDGSLLPENDFGESHLFLRLE